MGKPETITSGKKIVSADKAERRAKRALELAKASKATNVTFTLEIPVRRYIDAQAKAAGMNMTHYMQKLIEDHVIGTAAANDPLALRLAAKRHVIAYAVALATDMDASGKFDEHFILTVVKAASEDAEFAAQYALAIGTQSAAAPRAADRAKVSLNQQIGRLVKKAVGARSKRNGNGKIIRAQVNDALITTYTLLEKAAA